MEIGDRNGSGSDLTEKKLFSHTEAAVVET